MPIREMIFDPITRIEGHMAVHAIIDEDAKKVIDGHSYGTMFRGFEIILKGRDPPDSIFINQRVCGVCPVPHAYASALANDMALEATPPPLATALRDLTDSAELLYDHSIHLFQLAGPEYSEVIAKKFNPSWIDKAKNLNCEYGDIHGYSTIYDLMKALNPLSGELYLYTLKLERQARKLAALLGAKHPHVNTFVPGGVARAWGANETEKALSLVFALTGLSKLVVSVWEDLTKFLYDEIGYENVGQREANLISFGTIDDPEAYDAKYEDMSEWGEKRGYTPGVIHKGRLITTDLKKIHLGVRQYIKHSYYDEWETEVTEDPEGNPVAKEHPWNKETKPRPQPRDWNNRYSWGVAPRWFDKRNNESYVAEAGPIARIYASALAGKAYVESPWAEVKTGNGTVKISLPESRSELLKSTLFDAVEFEWKVPRLKLADGTPAVNTLERNRARAYCHAYYAVTAFKAMYNIISYLGKGQTEMWRPYNKQSDSLGVGLNEAARGALGHWMVVKDGKIHRYQIITPTAWNISPKDDNDRPGPVEEAIKGVPITEENEPNNWVGVDILRVVRSYDPCLACTVHVFKGKSLIKKVDVTSFSSFSNMSPTGIP